jgi:predicted transcriptional regulator
MDIKAEKLELIRAIINIEDISVLKKVKKLIAKQTYDWFDELTEEQQRSVLRGLEQADRGEGMPHEEALIRLGLSSSSVTKHKNSSAKSK